jgi:hypothetical protein
MYHPVVLAQGAVGAARIAALAAVAASAASIHAATSPGVVGDADEVVWELATC